jgi:hypothetical protein
MRHDSHVLRAIRSVGLTAAVAIGLSTPATASATTVTDGYAPPPSPLSVLATPFKVGMHVIEAIAEGLAEAVEALATPAPITVPAPHTAT